MLEKAPEEVQRICANSERTCDKCCIKRNRSRILFVVGPVNAIGSAAKQGQARQPRASKLCQRPRRLSLDLTPAPAEDHHRQLPELGPKRLLSLSTTRAENKEKHHVLRNHDHLCRPHRLRPHLHRHARPHQRQLALAIIRIPIQQKKAAIKRPFAFSVALFHYSPPHLTT